jgi:hypothetical protein
MQWHLVKVFQLTIRISLLSFTQIGDYYERVAVIRRLRKISESTRPFIQFSE